MELDAGQLFEEAKVLSSAEHLAAVFGCTVEDLAPYKAIIERARLVSEHEFMKRLKALMEAEDREAIKLWAEVTKLRQIDKTVPISTEDQMTPDKVRELFKRT